MEARLPLVTGQMHKSTGEWGRGSCLSSHAFGMGPRRFGPGTIVRTGPRREEATAVDWVRPTTTRRCSRPEKQNCGCTFPLVSTSEMGRRPPSTVPAHGPSRWGRRLNGTLVRRGVDGSRAGRPRRSTWTIPTEVAYRGASYARDVRRISLPSTRMPCKIAPLQPSPPAWPQGMQRVWGTGTQTWASDAPGLPQGAGGGTGPAFTVAIQRSHRRTSATGGPDDDSVQRARVTSGTGPRCNCGAGAPPTWQPPKFASCSPAPR